ncbi:MAG TPA: DNA-binding response regulator, partial [Cellvibrionaceae bacterium]
MIFVHTAEVESARWRGAFPDALLLGPTEAQTYAFNADDIVWLLLAGDYHPIVTRVEQAGARLVAMTLNESVAEARRLMSAGARGYIHALAAPELLQQVQEVVLNSGLW